LDSRKKDRLFFPNVTTLLFNRHSFASIVHLLQYIEAVLAMKDKALERLHELDTKMGRYYPSDDALMQFLQAL